MFSVLIVLLSVGILVGGAVLCASGSFKDPGGWAKEVGGILLVILGTAALVLLVVDLAQLEYYKSYLTNLDAGVQTSPSHFEVDSTAGTATWSIPNEGKVIWVALTIEPAKGDKYTVVLKPHYEDKDANGRYSYTDEKIRESRSVSFWYGTMAGPSPLRTVTVDAP